MACGGGEHAENLQDETFDFICSLCTSKNKNSEADKYCVDCQDYYCATCVKFHEEVPALSRHKILDKGQFQLSSSQTLPMIPTERCERHWHNHVDMYCQVHDVVECPTCMATEHRLCHATFYIPEFLKNNKNTSTAQATVGSLGAIANKLKKYHSDTESRKNLKMKSKAELLQKIKIVRKNVNDQLDVLEQCSVKEVEEMFEPVLENIQDELKKLHAMEDSVSSAKNNLVSTNDNVSQDFVNIKKGEKLVRHAEACFSEWDENVTSTADHNFDADPILLAQLEKMVVLGYVKGVNRTETEDSDCEYAPKNKTTEPQNAQTKPAQYYPQPLYQAKEKKKYNIKHYSDDCTPTIISTCILEDGTIILADSLNVSLKCVDHMSFNVTDSIQTQGVPWQVCDINKNEVAVTCQNSGVQFFSLHPKMIKTNQFIPGHTCKGLGYVDGHLYISDQKTVYLYTLSGTKIQCFTGMTDQLESPWTFWTFFKPAHFSDISSVSVAKDGSKIYVTDLDNGLTVLDRNGTVLRKYSDAQLKIARYVCQLENNSILVLGSTSTTARRNVLQFGPGYELTGEVLKADKDSGKCQAIFYNHFSSKLIVTYSDQNEIEVYDLT